MLEISSLSLEYVRVPVSATEAGAAVNPTTDTVTMAFVAEGTTPAGGDFHSASWETDASQTPTVYYARCLVGPSGTVTLAAGLYDVFVKVADSPEAAVKKAPAPVRVK